MNQDKEYKEVIKKSRALFSGMSWKNEVGDEIIIENSGLQISIEIKINPEWLEPDEEGNVYTDAPLNPEDVEYIAKLFTAWSNIVMPYRKKQLAGGEFDTYDTEFKTYDVMEKLLQEEKNDG